MNRRILLTFIVSTLAFVTVEAQRVVIPGVFFMAASLKSIVTLRNARGDTAPLGISAFADEPE